MIPFAVISGSVGAAAFAVLLGLIAVAPRSGGGVARLLMLTCAVTVAWFAAIAWHFRAAPASYEGAAVLQYLEVLRNALWLSFIGRLLGGVADRAQRRRVRLIVVALGVVLACIAALIALPQLARSVLDADPTQIRKLYFIASLAIALGGLVLTEQIFRNASREARWALKHLCFGIGLLFAYDFYLYADAVLFNRFDAVVWSARGLVNALAVPMIAVSASRNREWNLNIFVSRQIVFHGVALVAAGAYLVAMAAAGYYIQIFGGEWGRALRIAFFSAALLLLLSLFFSQQLRSRTRMFLARHFYRNKYEYGDEWLKFTQALSRTTLDPASLNRTILNTIADMVDSPGGIVFHKLPSGSFAVADTLAMYEQVSCEIPAGSEFLEALQAAGEVWDIGSGAAAADADEERPPLPAALAALPRAAFIVPIMHRHELLAFLVLAQTRSGQALDREDRDLLATVGRQAASYLALVRATDALSEARQFETFNRLSAFLVHDLKNVVAQLSLITSNAARHGTNPEFVADAFQTVADAVAKMNRMLASLRQMEVEVAADETFDLAALAREAVERKADAAPRPRLAGAPDGTLPVRGARERLLSVVEHLLQNAVEATAASGTVEVAVRRRGAEACLSITDTGCGMDREFINTRLFKPFDTTKGKAGMGIGAYESRYVVSSMKGELRVESEPGQGTVFTVVLPLAGEHARSGTIEDMATAEH